MMFPKPTKAERLAAKDAERDQRRVMVGKLRTTAMIRSAGRCENPSCGQILRAAEMDHFYGGNGRRREHEAIDTVWMLCLPCHQAKTANVPNAEVWRERFARFRAENGYSEVES